MTSSSEPSGDDARNGQQPKKDSQAWQEELKQHAKEFIDATPEEHVK
jgi:hypothetical protein